MREGGCDRCKFGISTEVDEILAHSARSDAQNIDRPTVAEMRAQPDQVVFDLVEGVTLRFVPVTNGGWVAAVNAEPRELWQFADGSRGAELVVEHQLRWPTLNFSFDVVPRHLSAPSSQKLGAPVWHAATSATGRIVPNGPPRFAAAHGQAAFSWLCVSSPLKLHGANVREEPNARDQQYEQQNDSDRCGNGAAAKQDVADDCQRRHCEIRDPTSKSHPHPRAAAPAAVINRLLTENEPARNLLSAVRT